MGVATGATEAGALLLRCVAGDRTAWRELDRYLRSFVKRTLRRAGVPVPGLEDSVHDVLCAVYASLGGFDRRSALSTWVYRVAVNAARDARRDELRWRRCAEAAATLDHWCTRDCGDPAPIVAARSVLAHIDAALDALGPTSKAVWVRHEVECLPHHRIAEDAIAAGTTSALAAMHAGVNEPAMLDVLVREW